MAEEQKDKERFDELDIIGGGLLKLLMKGFEKLKSLFSPKNPQQ